MSEESTRGAATATRETGHPYPSALAVAVATALIAAMAHLRTTSFGLEFWDSAELALQAHRLGVTHPPGYPVHSALGWLFHLIASDTVAATTALSLVSTAVSVTLVALIVIRLTGDRIAGMVGGLVFGLHPLVWDTAVRTEVYNVNVMFVASMFAMTIVMRGKRMLGVLVVAVVYAISLGSSPASLLFFPAAVVLVLHHAGPRRRGRALIVLCLAVAGALILMMMWTISRAGTHPPMGTGIVPVSVRTYVDFLRGADYGVGVVQPLDHYLGRTFDHTVAFLGDFVWVGVLFAVVGGVHLWRRSRWLAGSLALVIVGNAGYFTYHPWGDYRLMLTPTYLVGGIWIGAGVSGVRIWFGRLLAGSGSRSARVIGWAIGGALLILPAAIGWRGWERQEAASIQRNAEPFVAQATRFIPDGALVVTTWRTFTPLLYAQQVRGTRPDIQLVELATRPRTYAFGRVENVVDLVRREMTGRVVVTNSGELIQVPGVAGTSIGGGWFRVRTADAGDEE